MVGKINFHLFRTILSVVYDDMRNYITPEIFAVPQFELDLVSALVSCKLNQIFNFM